MQQKKSPQEFARRHELALKKLTAPGKSKPGQETLNIPFPAGLAPQPKAMSPAPKPDDPLPQVDIIAMMDTSAESNAMADVLTPGVNRYDWYPYTHNFTTKFLPQLGPNAPARESKRLGSYYLTYIGGKKVLVYKTELHMHTDGLLVNGHYTLPIKDMLAQMIAEAKPALFLTTGTSGGVYNDMALGDVSVSRAAHFMCEQHYKNEPFNNQTYKSAKNNWAVPQTHSAEAMKLMKLFVGKLSGETPPSPVCTLSKLPTAPTIYYDGGKYSVVGQIPAYHPIITTDFFEFGTTVNDLSKIGMAVEMDDAVLGLVCSEMKDPPYWACVRNLSDPTINGTLQPDLQSKCAEYYYSKYGYWTTVMSALATWSIVAGFKP